MSGSPSTKFVGRSFNDLTNGKGYESPQGLAQPATQKSFLLAAHIRINGPFYEDDDQGQPIGPVLINVDDLGSPTKGFLIGAGCTATDLSGTQGFFALCNIIGNGSTAFAGFEVDDGAAGGNGRDLFIHFWFDADGQEVYAGFNGKILSSGSLGEDFEPATGGLTQLGAIQIDAAPNARLNCNSGLVSVESAAIYEAPESPDTLEAADVAQAIASMAMASMKLGTLVLNDAEVPSAIEGIFAGKNWTHFWKPGTTAALAPETLPDTGDAAQNVPLTRECAADEAPLVVADTGFAAGESNDSGPTNYFESAGMTFT